MRAGDGCRAATSRPMVRRRATVPRWPRHLDTAPGRRGRRRRMALPGAARRRGLAGNDVRLQVDVAARRHPRGSTPRDVHRMPRRCRRGRRRDRLQRVAARDAARRCASRCRAVATTRRSARRGLLGAGARHALGASARHGATAQRVKSSQNRGSRGAAVPGACCVSSVSPLRVAGQDGPSTRSAAGARGRARRRRGHRAAGSIVACTRRCRAAPARRRRGPGSARRTSRRCRTRRCPTCGGNIVLRPTSRCCRATALENVMLAAGARGSEPAQAREPLQARSASASWA